MSIYNNSKIILATKHKKEKAIRKPFFEGFESDIFVPEDYDTDQFGTFTGEIMRDKTAYETVIDKAKLAALQYGFDYAIANEGSFGPHPDLFFIPGDVELMSFIDIKNEIAVVEFEITANTNYNYIDIKPMEKYDEFLKSVKFPSHGVIVRSVDDNSIIKKGIKNFNVLNKVVNKNLLKYKKLRLESDMRAFMNPTRMIFINKLAIKLVRRLKKTCDICHAPGFGKISFSGNLPCESCGTPTKAYKNKILSCVRCDHQEKLPRPDLLIKSNPKYCPYCNP